MPKIDKDWIDAYFERGIDIANRRVFIGDIDAESADAAIKGMYLMETENSEKEIELFISSYGGTIYDALALYDVMQTIKCPIHTFGYGKVMSAAPLLLAAGDKDCRWVAANVTFMHHDWSEEIEGRGEKLKSDVRHSESLGKRWTELLAMHSNQTFKWWNDRAKKPADFYFTADEAIEWGIADAIWNEKN